MKRSIIAVLLAVFTILSLTKCSKDDHNGSTIKTYVLVPGAWQAPYAWETVKSQLEAKGQKVVVVQLAAHGSDQTAPQNVSMDIYRDKVVRVIDSLNVKVILVGHSLAGMVISEVAEKVPSKIEKMIYIAAYLPVSGQTLLDLANTDANSLLGKSLVQSADSLTLDVIHYNITNIFVQDGSDAIKALVLKNYRVEPAIPFNNKVILTAANYGSVNKYYIHTVLDHVISIDLQNRMVAAAGIKNVTQINSSHCPFLVYPDSVTTMLMNIAK